MQSCALELTAFRVVAPHVLQERRNQIDDPNHGVIAAIPDRGYLPLAFRAAKDASIRKFERQHWFSL